jgi:hypothetical protein
MEHAARREPLTIETGGVAFCLLRPAISENGSRSNSASLM